MKTGQGNGDALTWRGICEISNEAKSLSALLPDAGRSSETQLARVDCGAADLPGPRVRSLPSARQVTRRRPGETRSRLRLFRSKPAWRPDTGEAVGGTLSLCGSPTASSLR